MGMLFKLSWLVWVRHHAMVIRISFSLTPFI